MSCLPRYARVVLPALLVSTTICFAQPVMVTADRADGVYNVGDTVRWRVEWPKASPAPAGARYVLRSGGLKEVRQGELKVEGNVATLESKFDEPNTMLLEVKWDPPSNVNRAFGGAVAAPQKMQPAAPPPDDFEAFWKAKLEELSKVPPNPKLEQADAGKGGIDYWKVTLDNIRGTHVNGQLARPQKGEKLPALLILQWAGVYPLQKAWVTDRAAEGWLTLNILPHDLPIDNPTAFYKEQYDGPLKNYWTIGNEDPNQSYYLRMYLSCVRALEYLKSRPDWDGKTLVVHGTSQGGQQALAGLKPDDVTAVLPFLPAACDMLAPEVGRASGFPNWYVQTWGGRDAKKVRDASRYYDPVNFARRIKCPALIGLGLHDDLAPPSSVLAAANVITAPKEIVILPRAGHQDERGSQKPYNDRAYGAWLPALRQGKPAPVASPSSAPSSVTSTAGPADQPAARNDDPVWVAKHAELRERAKQGGIDVYFVGDSITRRWPATHRESWERNFGGWRAASFGAGGDRTQNALYRLENGELDGVNPKIVVLLIGTNNVGLDPPPPGTEDALIEDTAKGVAACVRAIRTRAPRAKLLLMGITPRNTNGSTALMPIINRINEQIAKLADGQAARFLNINDQLADPSGKLFEGVTEDGLHLSNEGYQVWADAMRPILVEWLGPPSATTRPATQPGASAAPSAEQDHRRMLDLLKIDKLRRGADGNPSSPNAANSDESKAGAYTLPDPLLLNNGVSITSPEMWWKLRRPEIVERFDREMYGRVPKDVPPVKWEVVSTTREEQHGFPVVARQLIGRVDNSACPSINVEIQLSLTMPANASGPVPVVMEFGFGRPRGATTRGTATRGASGGAGRPPSSGPADAGPRWQQQVLSRGWGYAIIVPSSIQADNGGGLTQGIIGLTNKGQPRKLDDWGALRAWAWGASRALDYFHTNPTRPQPRRHRRPLALRQGGAGDDGVRRAVRDWFHRFIRRGWREAAPPRLRRACGEPRLVRRIPLVRGQLPEVRRPAHAARLAG